MRKPLLLPEPQSVKLKDGRFTICEQTRITLTSGTGDRELMIAHHLAAAAEEYAGCRPVIDRVGEHGVLTNCIDLVMLKAKQSHPDTYALHVFAGRIDLAAPTSEGLFYGVQTLIQLIRQYGEQLPCMVIMDYADFRHRGFMLDVSRGRVPTLEHLKRLVDLLAHFKINMLQLYVEHTFAFRSHPEIGEGSDPLEPGEILELDRYCRARHVELVPSLQSFGHMGRILSLPKFRHLAELEQFDDWETAPWRERLHGMMITPVDEDSYALLAELYDEFLPNFTSAWFNLNSDETWDLGKGRSKEACERLGVGRVYLRHIERIADMAVTRRRLPMIWADIIYQHPDLIPRVPHKLTLLDWGYDHDSPFGQCRQLAASGHDFFVCPGVSGWDQLFNDVWNATLNIRQFVAAGKEYGAIGVLNTDWGDCGHFNMPAASYHGAVLGAAMSWNEGRPETDAEFDRAFSLHVFDDAKGVMGHAVRRAGSLMREKVGRKIDTWTLWASPFERGQVGETIWPDVAEHMRDTAADLYDEFTRCAPAMKRDRIGVLELRFGVSMLDSLAVRALIDHKKSGGLPRKGLASLRREWAAETERLAEIYETLWLKRSKPARLNEILHVFRKQAADIRPPKRKRKSKGAN